jgi:hypothetical protein
MRWNKMKTNFRSGQTRSKRKAGIKTKHSAVIMLRVMVSSKLVWDFTLI